VYAAPGKRACPTSDKYLQSAPLRPSGLMCLDMATASRGLSIATFRSPFEASTNSTIT
jgi:hypothetical protein